MSITGKLLRRNIVPCCELNGIISIPIINQDDRMCKKLFKRRHPGVLTRKTQTKNQSRAMK